MKQWVQHDRICVMKTSASISPEKKMGTQNMDGISNVITK